MSDFQSAQTQIQKRNTNINAQQIQYKQTY